MRKIIFMTYYELSNGSYRVMRTDKPKEFFTYEKLPITIQRRYHMFKGYEPSDQGLKQFTTDFKRWCKELNKTDNKYRIDYTLFYSHWVSTIQVFKKLSKKSKYELIDDNVSKIEARYISMCHNGGLTYCNPGTYNCYGYDYNSFYPRCLGSQAFKFPIRQGRECLVDLFKLLKSNTKLDHGYYNVQITSTNSDTKKIFAFSKEDMYTNYSVQFAWNYRKEYNFKFAFYKHNDFNCYLYYTQDLVTGDTVFENWLETLTDMRAQYPKNKLLKHLLSSLWGSLTKANTS